MWLIVTLVVLLFALFRYLNKPFKHWSNKNVKYIKPLPIFGNSLPIITRKVSHGEFLLNSCQQFPNERYIGAWQFFNPVLIVKDPEIIKNIAIKDFETFPDRRPTVSLEVDPLWRQNLFSIEGHHKWHRLRTAISPAYSKGKMKAMYATMQKCTSNFLAHLNKNEEPVHEIEIKDAFTRLANDILAATAFGVTCNTLSYSKNEFYQMVTELSDFTGIKGLMFILNLLSPVFEATYKVPVVSKRVGTFFSTLITDAIKYRKENGITRPDILQLLMTAQDGKITYDNSKSVPEVGFAAVEEFAKIESWRADFKITNEVITAQAIVFLFAGIDTVSTFISYTIYELSLNPDVQKVLYAEIEETLTESNGEISYENLTSMKYLDMVVSECLRKWPPFMFFDRKAAKPYTIPAKNVGESDLILDTNSVVILPIFAIHRDPHFYPNPETFDPERFNDKNRSNIIPYSYIPFGAGPRNCIGSRFALLEGKLAVVEIVRNFEIVRTEKTKDPIVLNKNNFLPLPTNGIWVGLIKRKYN